MRCWIMQSIARSGRAHGIPNCVLRLFGTGVRLPPRAQEEEAALKKAREAIKGKKK